MTTGSQLKQTLAGLKGAQAALKIYTAHTQEEEIKNVFDEALEVTGGIISDLENRLKKVEFEEPEFKGN